MNLYDEPTDRFPVLDHRPWWRRATTWAVLVPASLAAGWVAAWSYDDGTVSDHRERATPWTGVVRPDDTPVPPLAQQVADERPRIERKADTVDSDNTDNKPQRPTHELGGGPVPTMPKKAPASEGPPPTTKSPYDDIPLDDTQDELDDNPTDEPPTGEPEQPPTTAPPSTGNPKNDDPGEVVPA